MVVLVSTCLSHLEGKDSILNDRYDHLHTWRRGDDTVEERG
jgi:hypothetical protein